MRVLGAVLSLILSTCYPPAVRLNQPAPPETEAYAPAGLDLCADAQWYRQQFGLPEVFDRLAWRESNCRNDVRTSCCLGIWQLSVRLHLRDHRIVDGYHACGITNEGDVFGEEPVKRWRQACAVKVLYDKVGLSPWR